MANSVVIKPKLIVINDLSLEAKDKEVATYSPYDRTIKVGLSFLELTRKFGLDSTNARAHVLSHELAHLFLNHGYTNVIGTGFASSLINKELKKSKEDIETKMGESEADQWAFFYAHVAGYKTNKVAPNLLDSIYKYYQLSDQKLSKYPSLAERKNYALQASKKMESMCEAFDFANIGLIHKDFDLSIEIYTAILEEGFKSREVISNLGTAYLLKAIQKLDTNQLRFILPIQIDMTSRLNQDDERGIVDNQEIIDLLTHAVELYNQSITIDPAYSIGYLNLSIAYWLLDKKGDSQYFLNKANNEKDQNFIQKVQLFQSITFISSNIPEQLVAGKKILIDLADKGNVLAILNRNILEKKYLKVDTKKGYPDLIKEISEQKLPNDFQNSTNLIENTFKKNSSLMCKEVNSTAKYRKWKSMKENSHIIAKQYFFESGIISSDVFNKETLYEGADAIFETSTAVYFKFGDIIVIMNQEEKFNYQIIKSL